MHKLIMPALLASLIARAGFVRDCTFASRSDGCAVLAAAPGERGSQQGVYFAVQAPPDRVRAVLIGRRTTTIVH
jgi:hypothetical protein